MSTSSIPPRCAGSAVMLTAWLYTATRNAALDLIRSEQRRAAREQEAFTMQTLSAAPPDADWEKLRPVLDGVMDELNEADRTAVLLRFFEQRPFADIGAALNLSEDAARMRVERALDKLHTQLARRGVTSTAGALAVALSQQAVIAAPADLPSVVTGTALAAVEGVAESSLGFLQFMSNSKLIVGVAGLVLVICVGSATREIAARRSADVALAAAMTDRDRFAARSRTLAQAVDAAEKETTQLKTELEVARAAVVAPRARTGGPAPAGANATGWDQIAEGNAFMARHPAVKDALENYTRARARFRFAPLLESLHLSPAQEERFLTIMGQGYGMGASTQEQARVGRQITLMSGGGKLADDYNQFFLEERDDEGRRRVMEFRKTELAREDAVRVAGALWFTETPLTPEQADRLVQLMTANRTARRNDQRAYDWDAIITAAGGLLSAPQLAILSGMQARDRLNQVSSRPAETPVAPTSKTTP
jgi:RNA polymerase sigma factor (sigma-70 family)